MISLSKLLRSRPQPVCGNAIIKHFFCSEPASQGTKPSDTLYRRITPMGDPDISMVPVLDQWVQEGRDVNKSDLQNIIKELTFYRRFKQALEISQWMTDRRYLPISEIDASRRLNLLYRVHGLEQAEMYYNGLSQKLKYLPVNTALLNCYAHESSVEKAEGIMQKLRDTGLANIALPYNLLMNLYYNVGSWEKLDILMHEMEEKGIYCDKFTLSICLSAYAATSNSEGIDKIVTRMKSDPRILVTSKAWAAAANGYLKVGLVKNCLEMLKKMEAIVMTTSGGGRKIAYNFLLKKYAETGKKDELYRIWNLYKKNEKVLNKGYSNMISSLLKFDDIEGAENIFEEWWESRGSSFNFLIPDYLIDAYIRMGHLKKAEALLNRGISKGGNPSIYTLYYLAGGYFEDNQVLKAVDALKKATQLRLRYRYELAFKEKLVTCLEYLDGQRDVEEAEEFIRQLKMDNIFSETGREKLLSFIKYKNSKS